MTKDIPTSGKILELGPGTGVITEKILERARQATLELIESDAELAALCVKRFPGVQVNCGDAEKLLNESKETYDAIVCGIPFGAMDGTRRKRMFALIHRHLSPGGMFVMLQYSLTSKDELQQEFGHVDVSFTPLNVPPSFVYTVRRQEGRTT